LTATILLNHNIPVYLFSKVCPTPFVPFSVLHYKCAAGVMVTASHNPKEDNGYKVYWENGAQVSDQYLSYSNRIFSLKGSEMYLCQCIFQTEV